MIGGLGRGNIPLQRPQFGIAVEHELDRGLIGRKQLLGDVGNGEALGHVEGARIRMQLSTDQAQQAGLAAAVLTGEAGLLAPEQCEGGVGKQYPRPAPEGDIGEIQHGQVDKRQSGRQG